jgi:hypothetical protein
MLQLPDNSTSPFLLFHRSGLTMKLYDFIIASVEKGEFQIEDIAPGCGW